MADNNGWDEVLDAASGDVRRLSYVDRYTSIPVSIRENVAEHSFWVVMYSMLIHRNVDSAVGSTDPQSGQTHAELTSAIMSYALTHDLVECVTGDLVRTFKYSMPELKAAVDAAEERLVEGFDFRVKDLMGLPESAFRGLGPYGKAVVKAADFVSLHQYMVREVSRGNREIAPFYKRMKKDLKSEGERFAASADRRIAVIGGLFEEMSMRDEPGRYTA